MNHLPCAPSGSVSLHAASAPPAPRPLRVGLVGWGAASQVFHAPLITTTPGLDLVAVVSRQPADPIRAALGLPVAVLAEPQALFDRADIDLVVIPTPNDTHHPLARAALRAGKAVVVDKPFALDAAQARELVDEAQARGLLLAVFHNRRWDGDLLTAAELLRAGTLGRIVQAQIHFDRWRPDVQSRWRDSGEPGSGLWLDLGPHLLDQAIGLFGRPVAIGADLVCARDGSRAVDLFQARLRYADGLRVDLGASTLTASPRPRFALFGTRGSWTKFGLDDQERALKAGQRPDPEQPSPWGADPSAGMLVSADAGTGTLVERPLPTRHGRYPDFYAAVRDALRGRGPNPVPPDEALAVMHLLDLGRRSDAERRELPCTFDDAR